MFWIDRVKENVLLKFLASVAFCCFHTAPGEFRPPAWFVQGPWWQYWWLSLSQALGTEVMRSQHCGGERKRSKHENSTKEECSEKTLHMLGTSVSPTWATTRQTCRGPWTLLPKAKAGQSTAKAPWSPDTKASVPSFSEQKSNPKSNSKISICSLSSFGKHGHHMY